MAKQDKYTKSAKGQECQVRIPSICNFNEETTIFAHINGAGMGMKHPNIIGSYTCSDCHSVIDGQKKSPFPQKDIKLFHFEGMVRTQILMIKNGVLIL